MLLPTNNFNRNHQIGECLSEIKDIDYIKNDSGGYLKVKLEVSNLEIKRRKVTINIFKHSYYINANDFIVFMETNDKEQLIGKLFYGKIIKSGGYDTLSNLYLKVDEANLVFDPRKEKVKNSIAARKINLKELLA